MRRDAPRCARVCVEMRRAVARSAAPGTVLSIAQLSRFAYGMPTIRVDGNDLLAVYAATAAARAIGAEQGRPTLVEERSRL